MDSKRILWFGFIVSFTVWLAITGFYGSKEVCVGHTYELVKGGCEDPVTTYGECIQFARKFNYHYYSYEDGRSEGVCQFSNHEDIVSFDQNIIDDEFLVCKTDFYNDTVTTVSMSIYAVAPARAYIVFWILMVFGMSEDTNTMLWAGLFLYLMSAITNEPGFHSALVTIGMCAFTVGNVWSIWKWRSFVCAAFLIAYNVCVFVYAMALKDQRECDNRYVWEYITFFLMGCSTWHLTYSEEEEDSPDDDKYVELI